MHTSAVGPGGQEEGLDTGKEQGWLDTGETREND